MISWRINDVFSIFIIPFPVILSPGWFSSPKSPRTSTGQAEFSGMPAPTVVTGVDWSLGYSFPVSFFLQSYVSTLWCRGSGTMPGSLHQVLSCLSSTQKHLLKKCEERSRHVLLGNKFTCSTPRRFRWPFTDLLLRKFVLVTTTWMWAWRRGEWIVWLIWLSETWGPFFPSSSFPWFHFFVP